MKIVAPVPYRIRGIAPKARTVKDHVVWDVIEWEIPEITAEQTKHSITVRPSPSDPRDWHHWRKYGDDFIWSPHGSSPLKKEELPHFVNGELVSNFMVGFLYLFEYNRTPDLVQAAQWAFHEAKPEDVGVSVLGDYLHIESDTRDAAMQAVVGTLEKLLLVDGMLWRKVAEPTWYIVETEVGAYPTFNNGDREVGRIGPFGTPDFNFPMTEIPKMREIADALGLTLRRSYEIESASDEWSFTDGLSLSMAVKAAEATLRDTAATVGSMPAETARAWIMCREMLENVHDGVDAEGIRLMTVFLREMEGVVTGDNGDMLCGIVDEVYPSPILKDQTEPPFGRP